MKKLKPLFKGIDVIIEVVDSRDIVGTRLEIVEKLGGTNRTLIVANKTDLVENVELPKNAIAISAKKNDRKKFYEAIMNKTQNRPVKALLIGYPNVGKSSLINMLANRKVVRVSPIAGTTKNVQWIRIDENLLVTDYRGIFPKKEEKEQLIRKKAINIEDDPAYGYIEAERIVKNEKLKSWVLEKLGIEDVSDGEDLLTKIAEKRKFIIKGGELNLDESSKLLLRLLRDSPEL